MEDGGLMARAKKFLSRKRIRKAGVWFIDVPRTSSTSIKNELGAKFGFPYGKTKSDFQKGGKEQFIPDHFPAKDMKKFLGDEIWGAITTFTIVRNPWSRMLSLYQYRIKEGSLPPDVSFTDYIHALNTDKNENHGWFQYWGFRLSAAEYLTDFDGKSIIVDHIIKLEDRDSGMDRLRKELNFPEIGHQKRHVSNTENRHYSEAYNAETRDIIAKIYDDDVRMFGYQFID